MFTAVIASNLIYSSLDKIQSISSDTGVE